MFQKRKPLPANPSEQPKPMGLELQVRLSDNALLQLRLSEDAVLRLIPLLIGVIVGSAGTGLWVNYLSPSATPTSPAADVQPRK